MQNSFPCIDLVSKILVPLGYSVEEILKVVNDEGCDVIILGIHGKGFLRQSFVFEFSHDAIIELPGDFSPGPRIKRFTGPLNNLPEAWPASPVSSRVCLQPCIVSSA